MSAYECFTLRCDTIQSVRIFRGVGKAFFLHLLGRGESHGLPQIISKFLPDYMMSHTGT